MKKFEKGRECERVRRKNTYDEDKLTLTIEESLKEFSDVVYRVARNLVKNEADAQDIYQEVFLRFMKYSINKQYDSLDHARHWFIRVTINCHHTFIERNMRREELEKSVYYMKDEPRNYSSLTEAVQELDEKYRIVVHLFYYEDYRIKEIAAILEENENTIKTRLARAKGLLKSKINVEQLGGMSGE